MSDALLKYSCQLPGQPLPPYRLSGSRTLLKLRWQIPQDNGGCNLTGFNLFRDDGAGGLIQTEVDPTTINDKPSLTQHEMIFLPIDTGKQFRYQLKVSNTEGSQLSTVAAFIIADVPDKPTVLPQKV